LNVKKSIAPFCFLFCLVLPAGGLWALGQKDGLPRGEITVTGTVRLVGTSYFNDLVITDSEDNDWYVEGEDRKKLASMEQREVTVKGLAEYEDIILADRTKAGIRRYLRKITLVE
jgi:hypothetical protein